MPTEDLSYSKHEVGFEKVSREQMQGWLRTDTADYWRHNRMYEPVDAFVHRDDFKWITIGDGRLGLDSIRIKRRGVKQVLPTDISKELLEIAKEEGLIDDFSKENAEKLSFADDTFDIAFCKESYHHFPRPAIAVYEMLRVARHAVIFIEPRDYVIDRPNYRARGPAGLVKDLISWVKQRLKMPEPNVPPAQRHLLGDKPGYEEVGNYVYSISSREFEKIALGLNYPAVAFKGLNDTFFAELGATPIDDSAEPFRRLKNIISEADKSHQTGKTSTSLLMAIIFKELPDKQTRDYLQQNDWLLKDLDRNPYIKAN